MLKKSKTKYLNKEELKPKILTNLEGSTKDLILNFYGHLCSQHNLEKLKEAGTSSPLKLSNNKLNVTRALFGKIEVDTSSPKLIDLFKNEGKGSVIEIVGEPLFPLKTTLDFLIQHFEGKTLNISKALQTMQNRPPVLNNFLRRANESNPSDSLPKQVDVLVEGTVIK